MLLPDAYYHIYNHGNGKDDIFLESENYRWFLQQYSVYIEPVASTLAFCLMPNHFHFLVKFHSSNRLLQTFPKFETLEKLENASLLSKQFSHLFSSYTQGFNKKYNRKGSLFLKNFKRRNINSDQYLSLLIAYIHTNPVSHGFTSQPGDWKWSSYNAIRGNAATKIERNAVLDWFGGRNAFDEFHQQYHAQKFPEISILDDWFRLT